MKVYYKRDETWHPIKLEIILENEGEYMWFYKAITTAPTDQYDPDALAMRDNLANSISNAGALR